MFEVVHPPRRFRCERPYLVFAELPSGRRQLCGRTPVDGGHADGAGVRIPEHVTWWVRPIAPADGRGLLRAAQIMHDIVTDLQDHDIPGLDLEHSDVDGRALVHLDGRAQLRWLHLAHSPGITDAALACLADLSWLGYLSLAGCAGVTDAGMRYLGRLAELRVLDLDGCQQIGAPGLARLSGLGRLEVLSMRDCCFVDDGALEEISRLSALQWLDLSSCASVTDDGLMALANLERLGTLRLSGCFRVTDRGLNPLVELGCRAVWSVGEVKPASQRLAQGATCIRTTATQRRSSSPRATPTPTWS